MQEAVCSIWSMAESKGEEVVDGNVVGHGFHAGDHMLCPITDPQLMFAFLITIITIFPLPLSCLTLTIP